MSINIKKITSALLVLCMMIALVPISVSADNDIDMYYIKPTGEVSEYGYAYTATYDEEGNVVEKSPAAYSLSEGRGLAMTSDYPASYSSVDVTNSAGVSIVSPVKDQGVSGTCWAQAANSAAETVYLRNYAVDSIEFSDGHLSYFGNNSKTTDIYDPTYGDGSSYADPYNRGGNNYASGSAFARWSGPELELYAPDPNWYAPTTGITYNETNRLVSEQHIITNMLINAHDINTVKYFIKNFGGTVSTYYSDNNYYRQVNGRTTFYQNVESGYNHAVYIVGWDDSIPASEFAVTPPGDGAWLVKNSWGTDWGDGGYFWMSYYEPSHGYTWLMDFEDTGIVDNNYQYDGSWEGGIGYFDPTKTTGQTVAISANTFTAKGDEILKEVGIYNMNTYSDYTVKIYVGCTWGTPDSGTLVATQSQALNGEGYRTINLQTPVTLTKGQNFSVVIENRSLIAGESPLVLCEASTKVSSKYGESMYIVAVEGASMWCNLDYNIPIKAFTSDISEADKSSVEYLYTAALEAGFTEDNVYMKQAKAVIDDPDACKQDVTNAYKRLGHQYNVRGTVLSFDAVLFDEPEDVPEPIITGAGNIVTLPENTPDYPGWAFVGWSVSGSSAQGFYTSGSKFHVAEDTTLKGIWMRADADGLYADGGGYYAVYYSPNGGEWSPGIDSVLKSRTPNGVLNFGSAFDFPQATYYLSRDGYRLQTDKEDMTRVEFWTGDGKGNTTYNDPGANNGYEYEIYENAYKGSVFMVNTDCVPYGTNVFIYAAWDPIITYDMNDGSGTAVQDFNYITDGDEYTVLGTGGYTGYSSSSTLNGGRTADGNNTLLPNREGYKGPTAIPTGEAELIGWNTRPDGTGTTYAIGQTYDITEPLTLYAIWDDGTDPEPYLTSDGPDLTVHELHDVKDYFIALGEHSTYREVKNNLVVQITSAKIATLSEYTYTVKAGDTHTVLIRYNDGTQKFLYIDIDVTEPAFVQNGLQLTVGNLTGVKVIRTAYGEYNSVSAVKRGDGYRSFTAKNDIKNADQYMIQYRKSGTVTVAVQYNDGYTEINTFEITQKTPTFSQDGNTVTIGNIDDLYVIRYAEGEYTTASQIKAAAGSKVIKLNAAFDGVITVTGLKTGVYTFCVQYNDESYNYYVITVC